MYAIRSYYETLSPVELAVAEEPLVSAEDNAEELELDISGVDDLAAVSYNFV